MANRFIPYVPKPTNEKYHSKPLCKNVPKEFSILDDSQQVLRNPVQVSVVDGDLPMQKVNRDNGIVVEGMLRQHILLCLILMQVESLTEICKSSNSDEDEDDTYFPTVQELTAKRGMSGEHAPKVVDKPALDDNDCSINLNKSISGPNLGNSQGIGANS
jgi:hypothetical protein